MESLWKQGALGTAGVKRRPVTFAFTSTLLHIYICDLQQRLTNKLCPLSSPRTSSQWRWQRGRHWCLSAMWWAFHPPPCPGSRTRPTWTTPPSMSSPRSTGRVASKCDKPCPLIQPDTHVGLSTQAVRRRPPLEFLSYVRTVSFALGHALDVVLRFGMFGIALDWTCCCRCWPEMKYGCDGMLHFLYCPLTSFITAVDWIEVETYMLVCSSVFLLHGVQWSDSVLPWVVVFYCPFASFINPSQIVEGVETWVTVHCLVSLLHTLHWCCHYLANFSWK